MPVLSLVQIRKKDIDFHVRTNILIRTTIFNLKNYKTDRISNGTEAYKIVSRWSFDPNKVYENTQTSNWLAQKIYTKDI